MALANAVFRRGTSFLFSVLGAMSVLSLIPIQLL
jgi:hypothetical protein